MPQPRKSPPGQIVYADTSFLISLYLRDANTDAVTAFVLKNAPILAFTPLQRFELRNALRLLATRKTAAADIQQAISDIDADVAAGDLLETALIWPDVLAKAEQLSEAYTPTLAVRSIDLIHVAAATTIGAKTFLTCDDRQREIARAAGLSANPN